jgi:surfactin family lipopeptide synthetase A
LDSDHPAERLEFMLQDCRAQLVLATEELRGLFPEAPIPVCCLDTLRDSLTRERCDNPANRALDENLAYIMYTSGSTGKPKGVMISHRNVVGFLHSFKSITKDGPWRVGTSVATFGFDTSVEEFFSPLCFGGTLHLLDPEESMNAARMADYLSSHQVTTSYILPFFLSGIAGHLRSMREHLELKCVITGLEAKKERVLQEMRDVSERMCIWNAYGPTEVTYGATAFEFTSSTDPDRDAPIGRPFPNYQVFVVDSHLQPLPVGVCGELIIGGVGLSRGYFNRPDLTADRFIPNPFSREVGSRLYRTGDLARYLPDGNLEFLGRRDHQIKIRGFRVELGEIEAVLAEHPQVQRAAVLAHTTSEGDTRLTAYVVPCRNSAPAAYEIRAYLNAKLPRHMVPSSFVMLDALPMTPGGKVDRRALPAPEQIRPELEEAFVAPRTPCEEKLAGIWAEFLGFDQVGVHDNFFALGGHSLLATQIMSRIRRAFRIQIPLRRLFQTPTIAGLAEYIERIPKVIQEVQAPITAPADDRQEIDL